jgi:putative ABC transport system permease protein
MLRRARHRVASLWNRRRREREIEDEIRFHLSEETEERVAQGLDLEQARAAANRDFGNATLVREAAREVWGWASAERLARDVQYALRTMRRAPGYSAVAVLTLALGIGANTAIFSLVNGILLRPLPYPEPERLVNVTGTYPGGAFVELRASATLMQVAAYAEGHGVNLSGAGEPVRLAATRVSAELLSILGARPALGRTFQATEDHAGRDGYAILSHALWEQRFARDPAIVGRSIVLDGVHREVVGVMPADFRFPSPKTQIWIPLHVDPTNQTSYWAGDFMPVVARLHAGVTLDQVRAEVRQVQARLPALFPWPMPASWNADVTAEPLQDAVVGDTRARLLILTGVVALVLLIACANVANLSLARAVSRTKEIAVRCALGAGPSRIARQVLTESVVLAVCGAALGLAVATQGLASLKRVLPPDTPRLDDVHADWRVLAFTAVLAVITGLAFGLAPALQASRTALTASMNAGRRTAAGAVGRRLRQALVVSEIALAVLLVTAAGLFIRSFQALSHVNAGFRPERVVTARITPSPGFCAEDARCLAFYSDLLDRLRALPGARGAALTNTLPLDGRVAKRSLDLEGRGGLDGDRLVWMNVVTPEYFRVMGIPVVAGRAFADSDRSGAPAALLSAATARRFWPENEAIGRQIRFVGETRWHTIVGVVGDVRAHDLRRDVPGWIDGTIYVPYTPNATLEDGRIPVEMSVAVLTAADVPDVGARLRQVVGTLSGEVPVSDVRTMGASLSGAVASPASVTALVASFGVLALALGAIGIYGVLSFLVSRRTRDIGIQMALGARRADVFRSIMKEGAQLALTGVGLGMAAALIATRILSGELYGVDPADPLTYMTVAAVMVIVTMGACCIPTYRATRVDALIALRQE